MYQTVFLKIRYCITIIFFFSCSSQKGKEGLPYYNTPGFTPEFFSSKKEVQEKIIHTIANFSMTDQHGMKITQENIEGKIHVANFIFTRCGSICPVMTNHMKAVQDSFKNDDKVIILSYSVTPWIDSIPRLKSFASSYNITSPNWHLLTGNKSEIYTLARQSYFAEEDLGFTKDSTDFLHTEHILLVDKTKRIRGIYNGTLQLEIEQLIKDITTLSKE